MVEGFNCGGQRQRLDMVIDDDGGGVVSISLIDQWSHVNLKKKIKNYEIYFFEFKKIIIFKLSEKSTQLYYN